jgi:hypothetical protein
MTHPRTQLNAIARIAANLARRWDDYETTSALLATDHGTDRLGVHGGAISDPTYAARIAAAAVDETATEIAEAYGHLRSVEKRITGTEANDPETARAHDTALRAHRCAEPACEELTVKHGYCERDWWTHRASCNECLTAGGVDTGAA